MGEKRALFIFEHLEIVKVFQQYHKGRLGEKNILGSLTVLERKSTLLGAWFISVSTLKPEETEHIY